MAAVRSSNRALILSALTLGGFAIGTNEFATMGLLPSFASGFGIAAPEASRAISAYAIGVVIGAPAIAVVFARVRRGPLLALLMLFYGATSLLTALAPTFPVFVAMRFLNGLPHGAYFGVAALVASSVSEPGERARTVARIFLGLTVATIVGVPLAAAFGAWGSWRVPFAVIASLAFLTAAGVLVARPPDVASSDRSPLAELGALARPQVWLTLAIGAVGFGGMFSVYTYLGPVLAGVTHAPVWALPAALAVFGIGLTIGNLVGASLADRALMPTIAGLLVWSGCADLLYALSLGSLPFLLLAVLLVGATGGLAPAIQTRLMDVAGDAQTLAASLMHSSFNIANAAGPAIAAWTITHGFGWRSTGTVGAALAVAGLVVWAAAAGSARAGRRSRRVPDARIARASSAPGWSVGRAAVGDRAAPPDIRRIGGGRRRGVAPGASDEASAGAFHRSSDISARQAGSLERDVP